MTETKVSLQIGNQPFIRQSQMTAQIQNAITHKFAHSLNHKSEDAKMLTHRETLKTGNRSFA